MKTNILLKVINPVLALVFMFQVITGLMHGIIRRELYEKLHGGGGGILVICVIIHIMLNWSWVKANFFKK